MPSSQVMHEFKAGRLHSGSKHGPKVTSRRQAIAIMLSEKADEDSASHEKRERRKPTRSKR